MDITILGIESSCDDTSAAVLRNNVLLSNVIASQAVHMKYGGVIPELASRAHQQNIIPVVDTALREAGITADELDAIAFTRGPGLLGSLLVGVSFTKGLSIARNIPMVEVNHLQGHILSHFIDLPDRTLPHPDFPFLCLLVSGGHSQIVLVKDYLDMEIVGTTIDDAAGEAFDKCAKVMGLPYPGGPVIDKLAKEGDPHAFRFAKPRIEGFDYSFSGLKTSFLYTLRDEMAEDPNFIEKNKADLCASLQTTIVEILLDKLVKASKEYGIRDIAIAGGVSANSGLRNGITEEGRKRGWRTFLPEFKFTTDNAAMIALAGAERVFEAMDQAPEVDKGQVRLVKEQEGGWAWCKPDGTKVQTETRADGTKIQTETKKDGSTVKTTTNPNGSSVTESKDAAGSTGTVKTDKNGQTTAETTLSSKAIETAKRNGEPVKAPVEVKATRDSDTAPTVKIELPRNSGDTKVEIPVSNVKPGTVAVLVHPDGTEEIVKNSLPTEDGIQLTINGGATVKIVDNSKDFADTRNHWAKDAIDFVSARGLVNGMSATIYAPNASTTRAQLWTILARQNNADLTGGATWFENAQNWAKAKGISDGANPNGTINRAQMVTMLWRAEGQPAAGGNASFADVPADSYYAQAVAWAVEGGITTGVGGGRFDPNSTCTRAQIATFLWRAMAE